MPQAVKALSSQSEYERYVAFAREVYAGNPNWRPGDDHHEIELIANRSAFAAHSRVQAFWAAEGDRVDAVVTALSDDSYNARWNEKAGHLVSFEARPGCDAAVRALFHEACRWLAGQG
ncbi:MAG: hypothetical protein ACRD96_25485, partial [Bryobacteraceae bacterium]